MGRLVDFLRSKWVIQFLGLAAVSALVWFAGPLIAIAGAVPLEPVLNRVLTIIALFLLWIIYRLVMQIRAGNREKQLVGELSAAIDAGPSAEAEASAEEVDALRHGFDEALALLRESRLGGQKGGRQFLYELPWYVIIGAPGSGKTTALVNSGLRFPLAERLGKHAVRGVSGTRNCDWWFTDEAVLLDTAGRYTTQDSHQAVDAAAWTGFLDLVKKHRPRRPLNGLMVTISLSDLLQQTEEERMLHAAAIRRRVQELYQHLGVRLPIYLMFTKSDLVAGFTDFFADMSQEDRAQVWGETFPAETQAGAQDFVQRFGAAYDELLQRLGKRCFKRVQDERDLQRRALILDYPQQMALLKKPMLDVLQAAFEPNRYEQAPLLRGVYFTSGTQEGTPIDRVMGILASAYRLDRQAAPIYSGRGKSFFLTRLLQEVIFPEAELAGVDARVERRQRLIQGGAYAAAIAATVAVIGLWGVSYARNQAAIAKVEEQIAAYRAVDVVPTDSRSNFLALLPRMNALLAARDVYRDAGLTMGLGLYQGDKLQSAATMAYERLLRDYFEPAISRRLKERMQGEEGNNPDILYQLLRVYLMFGDPKRLDAKVAEPWVRADWERTFATAPEVQGQLIVHLANLLGLQLEPTALDEPFVAAVRSKLTQVPQITQIYSRFKTEALLDHGHDLKLGVVLGPQGKRAFVAQDGRDIDALVLPGLFTAWGYTDLFLTKSLGFVKDAVEQNWVLGTNATADVAEINRLHEDLKKLYLADYQRAWSGLLGAVKLRSPQSANQTVELLDVLSRPDTPLKPLLETVDRHTSLARLASELAQKVAKPLAGGAAPDAGMQKLVDLAKQAVGVDTGPDPVRDVELAFEPLNELVRGGPDRPTPLAGTLTVVKSLHDHLLAIGGVPNAGGQALQTEAARYAGGGVDPVQQAKLEFARLPEPVRGWLLSLTSSGGQQIRSVAKGQLNDMVKSGVASQCRAALAGRYPFVRGAKQDVLLADFSKLFAPNGVIDQFFQANLKAFVDTTRPEWRELPSDKSLGLSAGSIRQFQTAARIRDAFFAAGGALPQVSFELKPLSLDNTVAAFRLNIEGQELLYRHGPEQITRFQWPGPSGNAGVRLVFETLDGRQASRFKEGPWALFRVLDEIVVERTGLPDRFNLSFQVDGFTARFELRAASVNNPFGLADLQAFHCPESL